MVVSAVAAVHGNRGRRRACGICELLGVFPLLAATAVGAPAAAEDAEDEGTAYSGGETNDERKMAVDPGLDFAADGAVGAATVLARSSAGTGRTVQEVLLESITSVCTELRARTAEHAVAVVTSVGVIALSVATHDCLTLLVTRSTLAAGTGQATTAAFAVGLVLISGAVRSVTSASLLRVARAFAGAADGT